VQIPAQIWADIVKRPDIIIGMAAFVLMLALALTSNNGPLRWRALHRLTQIVVSLGAVHFVMVVKGWQMELFWYLAGVLALLATRLRLARRQRAAA
jgi:sulfoxide reductase heme-binding subunit YedZ